MKSQSNLTIPSGWEPTKLGLLGNLFCGQSPSSKDVNSDGKGIPYVTGPEQWNGHHINANKWTTAPKREVPDGTLFITVKGSVGEIFPGTACAIGRDIYAFKPVKDVPLNFIYYALEETINEIKIHAKGDIPGISKVHITDHNILLPPLAEQERIVAKIEELFPRLDAGVKALQAARKQLTRYRAAVLKAAFSGKLTADWRKKLRGDGVSLNQLIDKLGGSLNKKVGKNNKRVTEDVNSPKLFDLPKEWRCVRMRDIGNITGGVTKNSKKNNLQVKMPYLRVANVYADLLDLEDIQEIGLKESEVERVLLKPNDILVVEGNGSLNQIGRVALWNGSINPCVHQNHIIKIRFNIDRVARYILLWLLSPEGRQCITQVASSTSGLHTLSLSKVKELPVPFCTLEEQELIVQEIDCMLSLADAIEKSINDSLAEAGRLRQSILKKAFEGRLVPQDPNDEPASELLKRIKAERETMKPATKTRVKAQKRTSVKKKAKRKAKK